MASVLDAIRAKIKDHLETTSIVYAVNGIETSVAAFPAAFFQISNATHSHDTSSSFDRNLQLEVEILGSSIEQVDLALEEVMLLWLNQEKFLELSALGVMLIRSMQDTPAIAAEGKNRFYGYALFELEVRYDYTI